MRTFEVVLLVLGLVALVVPPVVARRGPALAWLAALGAVLGMHVVVEGARWQAVPAATVLLVLAVVALRRTASPAEPRPTRVGWRTVGLLALGLSALLGWGLPVVDLPGGTGPWDVGRVTAEVVDDDRTESWGPSPGGPRRVVVTAWYPTDVDGDAPWLAEPAGFAREVGAAFGLPAFALGHLDLVRAPVVDDAPLAAGDGSWSVVVLSHGWSGFAAAHADLGHDLASRGFVVLALDHTHAAQVTTFPDGEVVGHDPRILPDEGSVDAATYQAASEDLEEVYAADAAAVLDLVAAGDAPPPLAPDVLDLGSVGLLGHSTGGGAMVRLCLVDERCGAVAGLDPWVEPVPDELLRTGVDVPLLAIRSEAWRGNANDAVLSELAATSADARLSWAPGTRHRDVTLQPMLSPLSSRLGLAGTTDPVVLHDAVEARLGTFFDRALRDGADEVAPPAGVLQQDTPD